MQYHPAGVDISDITVCKELFLAELTLGIYEGRCQITKKDLTRYRMNEIYNFDEIFQS